MVKKPVVTFRRTCLPFMMFMMASLWAGFRNRGSELLLLSNAAHLRSTSIEVIIWKYHKR